MQIDDSEADNIDTGASEAALDPGNATAVVAAATGSRKERQAAQQQDELPPARNDDMPVNVVKRKNRNMNPAARQAFADAVLDLKKQITEQGANVDEMDDLDLGDAEPAKVLAGEAKKPAAEQPTHATEQKQGGAPTPQPPAPSLDPHILQRNRQLDERERALSEREQQLTQRESQSDISKIYDSYGEQPVRTVMDLIKRSLGTEKDEDIKGEVSDLVSALSADVLGVELPDAVRMKMSEKQTKRIVTNHEKRMAAREQEIERKRLETERAQIKQQAVSRMTQVVHSEDGKKHFPWLSAEGNPGDIIADILDTHARQNPTAEAMQWTEAAKQADKYLEQQWKSGYESRKNLFSNGQPAQPAPTTPATKPKTPAAQQGDPAGIVGSRALTNAAASQPSAATPPPEGRSAPTEEAGPQRRRGWSNDRWRAQTRRTLRAAFRDSGEQEG